LKSLYALIFLLFVIVVSYIFNGLWSVFNIKHVFWVNLFLLIAFHPQHLDGLIILLLIPLKIFSNFKLKLQCIIALVGILLTIIKGVIKSGFGWILRILFFFVRMMTVSFINLVVFSILLTSVYVLGYVAFLKPDDIQFGTLYTAFGGLALLGAGIKIIQHFIKQSEEIAQEEFKKWYETEVKNFMYSLFITAKNAFPKFLDDLLAKGVVSQEEYQNLIKLYSHILARILKNDEEKMKIPTF